MLQLENLAGKDTGAPRLMGCLDLQQSDAHWNHEPGMPKSWEIKKGFFRFRGRSKPKLRNSEIGVFEFLSFGFAWWFMGRGKLRPIGPFS